MAFKKPFRAIEIQLAEHHRVKRQREQRRRSIITTALVAFAVFAVGMVATNYPQISRILPTSLFDATAGEQPRQVFYRSCGAARAAGHAPMRAGSPGYRIALDADGDELACEPFMVRRSDPTIAYSRGATGAA